MNIIVEEVLAAIGSTSLRVEVSNKGNESPLVRVYCPSEAAFLETCSRTKGGPALTAEGAKMRAEAYRIREMALKMYPSARVVFDIEPEWEGGAV